MKPVTINLATVTIDVENLAGATFGSDFTGPGILNKTGPGQLIITNPDQYAGVVIEAGGLQLGSPNQNNGANIATVINNGSLVLAGGSSTDYMSGSGSVTITGPSGVSFLGISSSRSGGTYTGPTNVIGGGTLVINGDLSAATGAITVDNGILAGFGVIGGSITVNANGAIQAGGLRVNRFNPLIVNANVTINAGGTLNASVNRTGVGTANASVISLTNPNSANSIFNLNVGTSAFNIALLSYPQSPLVPGETYTITLVNVPPAGAIELNGVPVGANYSFTNSSPASYNAFGSNFNVMNASLFTDNTGTQLELTFSVVPEPAHVLLIAVVGLFLAAVVLRFRNKKAVAVVGARSF